MWGGRSCSRPSSQDLERCVARLPGSRTLRPAAEVAIRLRKAALAGLVDQFRAFVVVLNPRILCRLDPGTGARYCATTSLPDDEKSTTKRALAREAHGRRGMAPTKLSVSAAPSRRNVLGQ